MLSPSALQRLVLKMRCWWSQCLLSLEICHCRLFRTAMEVILMPGPSKVLQLLGKWYFTILGFKRTLHVDLWMMQWSSKRSSHLCLLKVHWHVIFIHPLFYLGQFTRTWLFWLLDPYCFKLVEQSEKILYRMRCLPCTFLIKLKGALWSLNIMLCQAIS